MFAHLARDHEQGEDHDEGTLGHWQPLSLLHGEENGSVQTGFGWAAEITETSSVKQFI